jgi:hypothetical protein
MESFLQELKEHEQDIERLKPVLMSELENLDWPEVFKRMDELVEEESWSPLPLNLDTRLANQSVMTRAHPKNHAFGQKYTDEYWRIHGVQQGVFGPLKAFMHLQWTRVNEFERPSLLCMDCGSFAVSMAHADKHECNLTMKCPTCGHTSSTYDRHKAHMRSKHLKKWTHACSTCSYNTDSKVQFERHMSSSKHLEAAGTPKSKEFACERCDKSFRFKSELERHSLTKRCGKTLNI